jgi:hypothetical protein
VARPRKDEQDRKTVPLKIMLTPQQRARLDCAAAAVGLDVSTWGRAVLLQAAGRLAASGRAKRRPR